MVQLQSPNPCIRSPWRLFFANNAAKELNREERKGSAKGAKQIFGAKCKLRQHPILARATLSWRML
jgi:hypothetical protein